MSTDKYNLNWNGHKENSLVSFKEAHIQQEFTDVTLVTEDDKQIESHKFILGSSSPVFRKILISNPHPHPLIYLSGVKHEELKAIIEFMYLGETEVAQESFEHVMNIAVRFQVKGLSEKSDLKEVINDEPEIQVVNINIKEEKIEVENSSTEYLNTNNEIDTSIKSAVEPSATSEKVLDCSCKRSICDQCSYKTSDKRNFNRHVRTVHSSEILSCDNCDYQTKGVDNLRLHARNKHS